MFHEILATEKSSNKPLRDFVNYLALYPIADDLRGKQIVREGRERKTGLVIHQSPATLTIKWNDGKQSKLCVAHQKEVEKYSIIEKYFVID